MKIIVDFSELRPGGETGGVKPFLFALLKRLRTRFETPPKFIFLTNSATHDEVLHDLAAPSDELICVRRSHDAPLPAASAFAPVERIMIPVEPDLPIQVQADVFYAPFGTVDHAGPGVPIVSFVADLLHRDYPATLPPSGIAHREKTFAAAVERSVFFQCNSRHVIDRLHAEYGVPRDRAFHTYNLIHHRLADDTEAALPSDLPDGPFFFYPANAWLHKNHDTLLTAYRHYKAATGSKAWPLVMTGHDDDSMGERLETAAALGLEDSVIYLGFLEERSLCEVWRRASALIFPSLHEGFGIPLIEAMHFAVPILASNICSLPEVAGDAAIYFDPRKPLEIAEAMRRVSSDDRLRERLIEKGSLRLRELEREDFVRPLAQALETASQLWPVPTVAGIALDGWVSSKLCVGLPESARHGGKLTMAFVDGTPEAHLSLYAFGMPLGSFANRDLFGREITIEIPPGVKAVSAKTHNGRNLSPQDPRIHSIRLCSIDFEPTGTGEKIRLVEIKQ
ncbi:MAG: glycosyltransferase family 1 protein [Verrucomicrobia bacterium]|nr:MAG: glycosyltransferase family 1 protein [Verrucomicrobiota bacterium]